MTAPAYDELLTGCERSAVHPGTRDGYMRSAPMFTAWQQGHRDDPDDRESWWRPWLTLIQQTVARGVEVRRARIVSEPMSDYIQFEYDVTFTNVAAGEQVRWLPRRQASGLALPGNAFWLFDGRLVLFNHFTGNGEVAGTELSEASQVVDLCHAAFEATWERATPHEDYRPS